VRENGFSIGSIGKIQANPSQSKHLETATVKMFDLWIDFVNLRSEVYAESSRIPEMKFGTPSEDASRRDFTINSMFYNLSTQKIEDHTKFGLNDLKEGIIRTPIDPKVTLLDDPLRVLRAVRFGSRFSFELSNELFAAAKSEKIKTALSSKVSRERFGIELEGMLSGKSARPSLAINTLQALDLLPIILSVQSIDEIEIIPPLAEEKIDFNEGANIAFWMGWLIYQKKNETLRNVLEFDKICGDVQNGNFLQFLGALLVPVRHFRTNGKQGCTKVFPLAQHILKELLKLKSKDVQDVTKMLFGIDCFIEVKNSVSKGDFDRIKIAELVNEVGNVWEMSLELACAYELSLVGDLRQNIEDSKAIFLVQQNYEMFKQALFESGLNEAWKIKPWFNGKELIDIFNVKKGPFIGNVMKLQMQYIYKNPKESKENLIEHLRHKININ